MPPFPDYPIPADEAQRLRDLQRHGVLDSPDDPHLDRIVDLAAAILATSDAGLSGRLQAWRRAQTDAVAEQPA